MTLFDQLPRWLQVVVDRGVLAGDSEQVKAWKRLTHFAFIAGFSVALVFGMASWASGDLRGVGYAALVCGLHAVWLVLLQSMGHRFDRLIRVVLWGMLVLHGLVLPWLMGGPSSAYLGQLWSLFMVTYGVMFYPRREAWLICAGCVGAAALLFLGAGWAPPPLQLQGRWADGLATWNVIAFAVMASLVLDVARQEREADRAQVAAMKQRADDLLRNILPARLADDLVRTGATKPARHEEASVMFIDIVGFTQASAAIPAARVVQELNELFGTFDDLCTEEGVEKIKTIGDAYMAAAGVPDPAPDHAARCVRAALRILAFVDERNARVAIKCRLRVGIHSGPVVSGVVGKRKYAFDIWGDTVNVAARMESAGEPGRINVSAYTFDLLAGAFDGEYRGPIEIKGKGAQDMYFIRSGIDPARWRQGHPMIPR